MAGVMDLNADLGESFGAWRLGDDEALVEHITSANLACGFHAGDFRVMDATVALCKRAGVAVGAQPGYPDLLGFGRRPMPFEPDEVESMVRYQVGALEAFCRAHGVEMQHVKPHGALYNQAARDDAVAAGVLNAAVWFDLPLVGLPGSRLEALAEDEGHPFVAEGFADRRYRPDGTLVPRTEPDAFVHDPKDAVAQVEWLVREKGVRTVCVHGDNPDAVAFAAAVRAALKAGGFKLAAFA
jgi:5-oxoprolinase (ATP-hydrolysing) subunit A